ncbi:hypothetical protein B0H63DRAFT_35331 [Podospora didyma]|uniref:Secreted protein n=1 Tax=Podospora didyma TaxID=330526 RepID=A0AAE0U844_9PEZI|nr:hypothetical protein B0H63DRAFT_35331 [Podospora didyma]
MRPVCRLTLVCLSSVCLLCRGYGYLSQPPCVPQHWIHRCGRSWVPFTGTQVAFWACLFHSKRSICPGPGGSRDLPVRLTTIALLAQQAWPLPIACCAGIQRRNIRFRQR